MSLGVPAGPDGCVGSPRRCAVRRGPPAADFHKGDRDMSALEGLKLVKLTRPPFSAAEPWYRVVDETGRLWGSGGTPEEARQDAERELWKRRERHLPGAV